MLDLSVEKVTAVPHTLVPTLAFTLALSTDAPVEAILLHTQIRIEPTRRGYDAAVREQLIDLFGAAEDWSRTVHSLLWTHADVIVPAFESHLRVDLPVPCSFDFNVAATKYFSALRDGDVPLEFLFSGTIFRHNAEGMLQVGRVSWEADAAFRLPVPVWQEVMERHYGGTTWLRVSRDLLDRLDRCKRGHGFATTEQTLAYLVAAACTEVTV